MRIRCTGGISFHLKICRHLPDHSITINIIGFIVVREIKVPIASCKPCFGDPRPTPFFGTCWEGLASLLGDCQMRGTLSAPSWLGANVCHSFRATVFVRPLSGIVCLQSWVRSLESLQRSVQCTGSTYSFGRIRNSVCVDQGSPSIMNKLTGNLQHQT